MLEPGMQLWLIAFICFAMGGVGGQDNRSFRRPHEHHLGKRSLPSDEQKIEIVATHNAFRRLQMSSDMKMVKYNDYLASMASEYAQNCTWARGQPYRDPSTIPFPHIGQNMFASAGAPLNFTFTIQTWYNQGSYLTSANSCNAGQSCNNFLQVVWANTSDVGCGYANCPAVRGLSTAYRNAIFVICYYGPGGPVSGVKPYKIGTACTECFETDSLCINKLCASHASPDTVSTKATTQPDITTAAAATSMETTTQTTTKPIATTDPIITTTTSLLSTGVTTQPTTAAATSRQTTTPTTTEPIATTNPIITTATSLLPSDATTQPETTAATSEGATTEITTEESTTNGSPSSCTCACDTTTS